MSASFPDKSANAALPRRSKTTGRPPQRIAERLHAHILAVALTEFTRHGVEASSMDRIAVAAKVSKRTLYLRFGSRKAFILKVIEYAFSEHVAPVVAASLPNASLRERLLQASLNLLGATLRPEVSGLVNLSQWSVKNAPEISTGLQRLAHDGPIMLFRNILEQGASIGEIVVDDLDFMTLFMVDALVRTPRFRIVNTGEMENSQEAKQHYIEQALDFILAALDYRKST